MNKFFKRDLATSFTTFIFIVMATTGVFMFYHILDNYTKEMHKILGLAFVVIVFFHVFFNWKGMRSYFSKKVFLFSGIVVSVIALGFIANAPKGTNVKKTIIMSVINAPINDSLLVFNSNLENAKQKLEKAGLKIGTATTFQEIAKVNKTSPFNIINIITEK